MIFHRDLKGFSLKTVIFILAFLIIASLVFKPVMRLIYPAKYINLINRYSNQYNLDPHFIMAIISTESRFNEDAVSRKKAKGLMQLREDTAKWCMEKFSINNYSDIHSPDINIHIGCAYIRYLYDRFGTDDLVLAAYNAGEGNVSKWIEKYGKKDVLKNIPFKETKNYIKTVEKRKKIYRLLYKDKT